MVPLPVFIDELFHRLHCQVSFSSCPFSLEHNEVTLGQRSRQIQSHMSRNELLVDQRASIVRLWQSR